MTRAPWYALAAAAVFYWAAATGPAPPPALRAPSPAGVLFAPVGPLVRAWRIGVAQAAIEEGRTEDAIEALRIVEALDPNDPDAALFRANVLVLEFAARETSPKARFARIAEALETLARVEDAVGDRRLAFAAGLRLVDAWSGDAEMSALFERRYERTPTAAAVAAFARAAAAFPENGIVRRLLAETRRYRAIEICVRDGHWSRAAKTAADAAAGFAPDERDMPSARLAVAWSDWFKAASTGGVDEIRTATSRLGIVLEDVARLGGAGLSELMLAVSILQRTIDLGEDRAVSGGPALALSLAESTDSIRRFVDSGRTASGLQPVREILSRAAVVRLLEGVKSKDPGLAADADRVAANLLRISSR